MESFDKAAKTVTIGKNKHRTIHFTDQTKFLKADGKTPGSWDEIAKGKEVSGSYKKNEKGDIEALSFKVKE